jgi:outer membrane lipoprotein-sorting protein
MFPHTRPILLIVALLTACGCRPAPPPPKSNYYGQIDTLDTVLARLRANNAAVKTLWSRHDFSASFVVDGHRRSVSGDGALLHRKPTDLRFTGNEPIAGPIFELACNKDVFWVKIIPETDTMWTGALANIGKPGCKDVPFRPDLLAEVLAIDDIPDTEDPLEKPVLHFDHEADAYVLSFVTMTESQLLLHKELMVDRKTLQPVRVRLYEPSGRMVLSADLSQPTPIKGSTAIIASEYRLFFPSTEATMLVRLRDISTRRNSLPNDASFRFPSQPGVGRVIQVDADCPPIAPAGTPAAPLASPTDLPPSR